MTTATEAARETLGPLASTDVLRWTDDLVTTGTYRWTWDPAANGVAGLEVVGSRRHVDVGGRAVIIVYIEANDGIGDFECDEDALERWLRDHPDGRFLPPRDVLAKVAYRGHLLAWDPPHDLSFARRWTCMKCGDAALRYESNVIGSATERDCTGGST